MTVPKSPPGLSSAKRALDPGVAQGRHTAVGGLQNLAAQVVALSTGFATTVFLTRRLGPDLYGQYSVVFSVILWIEIAVASLLRSTTVKLVAETENWAAVSSRLAQIQLVVSAAAAVLLIAVAPIVAAGLNSPDIVSHLRLFALEIPLFALGSVHRSMLIGKGAFGRGAVVTAVYWLSRIALMLLLVGLGFSVTGAILANVGAYAVQLIVCRAFVQPALLRRTAVPISVRRIVGYALPLAAYSTGSLLVTKGDLLIVKASAVVAGAAGFYGAANDLAMVPVSYLVGSFSSLLLATLTQMWERGQDAGARSLARKALTSVLCLLPFAALAAGSAPGIIGLIYGDAYLAAAPLLAWLAFAAVGFAVISISTRMLIARGRPGLLLAFILPMATLALAGYLVLTPRFGSLGAAAARTMLTASGAIILLAVLNRACEISIGAASVWRIGLTTAIVYFASRMWETSGLLTVLELILLSAGIAASLFLLGELTERDVAFAVSLLRSNPERATVPIESES